eukprot:m.464234 g.464234  ORF g.464234 m.464234 type:complete len:137 (-) comp23402_c0_seq1:21-431(-)
MRQATWAAPASPRQQHPCWITSPSVSRQIVQAQLCTPLGLSVIEDSSPKQRSAGGGTAPSSGTAGGEGTSTALSVADDDAMVGSSSLTASTTPTLCGSKSGCVYAMRGCVCLLHTTVACTSDGVDQEGEARFDPMR